MRGREDNIKVNEKEVRYEMAVLIQLTRCGRLSVLGIEMNLRAQWKADNCLTLMKENSCFWVWLARLNELEISFQRVEVGKTNCYGPSWISLFSFLVLESTNIYEPYLIFENWIQRGKVSNCIAPISLPVSQCAWMCTNVNKCDFYVWINPRRQVYTILRLWTW